MSEQRATPSRLDPLLRRLVYGACVSDEHIDELRLLCDIDIAHTTMLARCGHLVDKELQQLRSIAAELKATDFAVFRGRELERGIYMLYESVLAERVGRSIAGKIHLGRSRNDLNATLYRLRLRPRVLRLEW